MGGAAEKKSYGLAQLLIPHSANAVPAIDPFTN